jgi:hypothetical protein
MTATDVEVKAGKAKGKKKETTSPAGAPTP